MAVVPSAGDLEQFVASGPDGPFVMLNLIRFVEGGRQSYAQYAKLTQPILARHGGQLVYAGDGDPALVAEDGQAWDAVLLVRYPSPEAFGRMVADPEYQQVTHLRTVALREAVLQPTRPWGNR